MPLTAEKAAALAGVSVDWLRTHECWWCSQTALDALRYGCGAIWGKKCKPRERGYHEAQLPIEEGRDAGR